jgi:hypothetical protein
MELPNSTEHEGMADFQEDDWGLPMNFNLFASYERYTILFRASSLSETRTDSDKSETMSQPSDSMIRRRRRQRQRQQLINKKLEIECVEHVRPLI